VELLVEEKLEKIEGNSFYNIYSLEKSHVSTSSSSGLYRISRQRPRGFTAINLVFYAWFFSRGVPVQRAFETFLERSTVAKFLQGFLLKAM
jgi:hypothetical protein